jgi:hypothetical protein
MQMGLKQKAKRLREVREELVAPIGVSFGLGWGPGCWTHRFRRGLSYPDELPKTRSAHCYYYSRSRVSLDEDEPDVLKVS